MDIMIRKMASSDLNNLFELLSDSLVMKYIESPYTKDAVERFLESAGLSSAPLIYAVDFQGEFAGYVIYHDYDENSIEIGWVIKRNLWGKGLASELTERMIEMSSAMSKDLIIECVPEQTVTKHIAEKYGFLYEGRSSGLDLFRLKR